jgi:hypothetical protein
LLKHFDAARTGRPGIMHISVGSAVAVAVADVG